MTSRVVLHDISLQLTLGQHIQSFRSQGSRLGEFHITRDPTGQIILADAKLENNIYGRMIIDDPVLLRMLDWESMVVCHDKSGVPWPPMQLNCVQQGDARQYILGALCETPDTLHQEAGIPESGKVADGLTAGPRPRFDLGRLVDLSRFPSGTMMSEDEFRKASSSAPRGAYNPVKQISFQGNALAPSQLYLAHSLNRPIWALPPQIRLSTNFQSCTKDSGKIVGHINSAGITDVLYPDEDSGRVLYKEEISGSKKGNSRTVESPLRIKGAVPGPAKPGQSPPMLGKDQLAWRSGPLNIPTAHPANIHPMQISSTHFELAKLLTDSDSEADENESYIAPLARAAKQEPAARKISQAMRNSQKPPHLGNVNFQHSSNNFATPSVAAVAHPVAHHNPGPIRNRTQGRGQKPRIRNRSPDHGLYPRGSRRDTGKALWENTNSKFPDDATRAQYRTYVQKTRLAVAKDAVAKAAFHAELAKFVIRMGVVREHNEYALFMRSGSSLQFHIPIVE
ncbi:hypothetical protein J1614_001361 [Plenodomus biglobosus]|nr:hypothetical protein J1614_001361 [Plenodomus biglobosus]